MGYYSDLDIDFRDAEKNPYIADVLGISYEELISLEYKFRTDTHNRIYHIEFDKDSPQEILSKIDLEDSDALFVSCTALPVLSIIDKLEKKLNKIILSSNQTLIWDALHLIGNKDPVVGFGKIFEAN